jgi:peptide deformylase
MATLKILEFPNPNLRKIAVPVTSFDNNLKCLIDNMFETMYEANGIGLAATQVDVHKRLLVLDVSEERNDPQVFVNPTIDVIESDLSDYDEGCLSVPGFYETVSRPKKIKVSAQDKEGSRFEIEADGVLSVCIQHEIDHLDGKLFVDYLSSLKRNRIKDKLQKEQKSISS